MNIPQNLPILPLQSKAARYQLGMTQANVIEESGLPGHKLKNFETGRFIPDVKFLQSLREFFEGKGLNLETLNNEEGAPVVAVPVTAPETPKPGAFMVAPIHRMAFYVSDAVPPDQLDALLESMDANDERIAAILKEPANSGLFSDRAELLQRELFGLMSANYLFFRSLQGRNIVQPAPRDSNGKNTIGDLLKLWVETSPFGLLLATTAPEANPDEQEQEATA